MPAPPEPGITNLEHSYSDNDSEDNDSDSPVLELLGFHNVQLESILNSISQDASSKESQALQSHSQAHLKPFDHIRGVSSYNILHSRYTGEGVAGGFQSVELEVSEGSTRRGVLQWLHFEPTTMHFGQFQQQVLDIPSLTDNEKQGIAKICKRVPKKFDLVAKGAHASQASIEPGLLEQSFLAEDGGGSEDQLQRKVITFFCIPFLYLGKYAGFQPAIQTGPKPMITLLQTRYDGVNEARDKLQASCQVLSKESQLCLHVPQLWCFAIGNDILITCAQIPHKLLRGEMVQITSQKSSAEVAEIRVAYGPNTVWSLPLTRCETWFDLISNFWEFWLNDFRIYCSGTSIDSQSWHKVWAAAKRAGSLKLTFQLGTKRSFQAEKYIAQTNQRLQAISPNYKSTSVGDTFDSTRPRSLYLLLQFAETDNNGVEIRDTDVKTPPSALEQMLVKIHHHLNAPDETSDGSKISSAYQNCEAISFHKLQSWILVQQSVLNNSATLSIDAEEPSMRKNLEVRRIEILSLVETLVEIFVPLDTEAICICKVWGAVCGRLKVTERLDPSGNPVIYGVHTEYLKKLISPLRKMAAKSAVFLDLVPLTPKIELKGTTLFNSLVQAFLQLISFSVKLTDWPDEDSAFWRPHYKSFMKHMDTATAEFVRSLRKEPLLKSTVFSPLDLGQLMTTQVIKDITNGQPDTRAIYKTYIGQLDDQINTDSSQRIYQQSLLLLRQEVETLKSIFSKQDDIVSALRASTGRDQGRRIQPQLNTYKAERAYYREDYYNRPAIRNVIKITDPRNTAGHVNLDDLKVFGAFDDAASTLDTMSATDPEGFRRVFADDSLQLIRERQNFFDGVSERIEYLDLLNDRKFSASADRRDLAVYAFAIVTIVFLPISTIAAIFSIDADNIPNLGSIQWLFWSVAAPLSVVIIFGGLLWAGELGNAWRGFISWLTQRSTSAYSAKNGYVSKSTMVEKDGEATIAVPASLALGLVRIAESRKQEAEDRNIYMGTTYGATDMRRRVNYEPARGRYRSNRDIF